MGKQRHTGISATIGNIIHYQRLGEYLVRIKPGEVRQTVATQTSARMFGKSAAIARQIRVAFRDLLLPVSNRRMINKLTAAVYHWLPAAKSITDTGWQPVQELQLFSFSEQATVVERLKPSFQTDWRLPGKLVVIVPAIDPLKDMVSPAGTVSASLLISIVCVDMQEPRIIHVDQQAICISFKEGVSAEQQKEWIIEPLPHRLVVIAGAIRYTVRTKNTVGSVQEEKWLPVGVIDARWHCI